MDVPHNCHIEYNEEGEPMLVEDDGLVFNEQGLLMLDGLVDPDTLELIY